MSNEILRPTKFAAEAAEFVLTAAREAITARHLFRLALAGGQTPRAVHAALVEAAGPGFPWDHVQITFGDERCVPPDDAESNYRMAKESLLDAVRMPTGNVFRMRGEIAPEDAAQEYEDKLAAVAKRFGEPRYRHDLVMLGMGPDGHTVSLFPGHPALEEATRNVIAIDHSPKPPPQRITMTFPLLNAARRVCFLVNDAAKLPLVEQIAAGDATYPAAHIRPTDGTVTWIVAG